MLNEIRNKIKSMNYNNVKEKGKINYAMNNMKWIYVMKDIGNEIM